MNEIKKNEIMGEELTANQLFRASLIDRTAGQTILSRAYSRAIFRPVKLARII